MPQRLLSQHKLSEHQLYCTFPQCYNTANKITQLSPPAARGLHGGIIGNSHGWVVLKSRSDLAVLLGDHPLDPFQA